MNIHSNPSSIRAIACAGCGQENPSDRKFCGQCGGRLWQPCLECSSINAVDERFCGNCGVKLDDSVQQHESELKSKLELAINLEREGRYYDAASKLREITESDERLGKYTQNALKLLEQLEGRRQQRVEESQQLHTQARYYFKRHEFTKAFKSLQAIPPGLREKDVVEFMIEVEGLHKELSQLTTEIRNDLKAKNKNIPELSAKVERLCKLQPDNEDASRLLERLSQQQSNELSKRATSLAKLAQAKIASMNYREASEAASQIEPEFRKGGVLQVFQKASELFWCTEQLKRSSFASQDLLKVVERWQSQAGSDTRADKIMAQLTDRLKSRPKDQRIGLPKWAEAPEQSKIGPTVVPWAGLPATTIENTEARQTLRKNPGRFMVAYGLALQGLGKAKLQHDLHPKRGFLGKLFTGKSPDRMWGIDIGSTSIKALELIVDATDGSLSINDCLLLKHSRPLYKTSDDEAQAEIITETLEEFVEHVEVKKPKVAVGFSSRHVLARFFNLPPIKSKKTKLEDAVSYEVKLQIPIPADEAIIDFHAWEPEGDGFSEFRPIAAIAARKDDMHAQIAPVMAAGCEVALLQCDGFALYNAIHHDFISAQDSPAAVAAIDVGGDATNLIVAEPNFVWMRSILHGTERWDEAIERDLPIKPGQGSQLRHDPSRAKWMHQVVDTLEPDFAELLSDLQRSLNGYPRKSISEVSFTLGAGGGASQLGFLQTLQHGRMNYSPGDTDK